MKAKELMIGDWVNIQIEKDDEPMDICALKEVLDFSKLED